MFPRFSRYSSKQATNATKAYLKLSNELGISLSTLSLAFVNDRPFVSSNIIGATSLEQLEENICSIETKLSEDVILKINEIHSKIPNPSP